MPQEPSFVTWFNEGHIKTDQGTYKAVVYVASLGQIEDTLSRLKKRCGLGASCQGERGSEGC